MEINLNTCVLGFGANVGNSFETIQLAIKEVSCLGNVILISPFYESDAWGFESNNSFVNCCAVIQTSFSPLEVLDTLQEIEKNLGRTQKSVSEIYLDRIIDIDILFFNHLIIMDDRLTIPHPLYHKRNFVLFPLNDIIPTFIDPKTKLTITYQTLNSSDKSVVKRKNNP